MTSRNSADESMSETWSQSTYGLMDILNMDISSQGPGVQQRKSRKESKGSKRTAKIPTETMAAKKLKLNEENYYLT